MKQSFQKVSLNGIQYFLLFALENLKKVTQWLEECEFYFLSQRLLSSPVKCFHSSIVHTYLRYTVRSQTAKQMGSEKESKMNRKL